MSFNSQFKLIFGETFQTEGFRYCSKLNVFVKMLNEDLMAFFGVKTAPAWNKGAKGFFLTAGTLRLSGVWLYIFYRMYTDGISVYTGVISVDLWQMYGRIRKKTMSVFVVCAFNNGVYCFLYDLYL